MKYILKRQEPQVLTDWKALENDNWTPTYDDLRGATKVAVKEILMVEQGYICCYCERRLTDSDSHIEHFQPQSDQAVDPLDFGNMLCSCQNQIKKGEPRHCGNLKDDWYDPAQLISPMVQGGEDRFAFSGDGLIRPADDGDSAAKETINKLGLDIPKLNSLRAKAIEPFLDEELGAEDLQIFVRGYLKKDNEGQFGEFWTTIRCLFGDCVAA